LSLPQAVTLYRQEYLIEQGFGRLKGQPLSVRPMFLQREDQIKGLIRLKRDRAEVAHSSAAWRK